MGKSVDTHDGGSYVESIIVSVRYQKGPDNGLVVSLDRSFESNAVSRFSRVPVRYPFTFNISWHPRRSLPRTALNLSSREDCPCRCCVRRFETRVARLDETVCLHVLGLTSGIAPPDVTHLIHQSALHERRHTAMMMKAQIAFEHASQLRHIVIHKASTRSKDNLPVTLRRLGDGVKFSRHLADFASAGMRGQARLSPMAPSRLHEGAAWESPNALSPTNFQGLLVCVFLLPILSLSLLCPAQSGPVP
jgi:hypothetical protein